jgi:hypothetical protein
MSVVVDPDVLDLSPHVVNAVVAHVLRWKRAPRVLLAISDDDLRTDLADDLRVRGLGVLVAAHAPMLHGALLRAIATPEQHTIDLFVVDAALDGCSPLHAIGYARQRGIKAAAILLGEEDERVRREAAQLDLIPCAREHALAVIDRELLRLLRRRWSSERPAAATTSAPSSSSVPAASTAA